MSSDHTTMSDDLNDTKILNVEDVEKSDEESNPDPPPPQPPRRKVQFLCPSTKVKDVILAKKEGKRLENRRVWTLILDKSKDTNSFNGTLDQAPISATGTPSQSPFKSLIAPALWLSANRWEFLPDSPVPLDVGYTCPEDIKLRLEEDVGGMKGEKVVFSTNVELFEAREYLMEWVVKRSGSDELVEFVMEKKLIDFTEFYNYMGEG